MKHPIRFGLALMLIWAGSRFSLPAASALPRATPELQGVSSTALLDLVDALDQKLEGMHSVMVARHGRVIAEGWWAPYAAGHNHVLYSLSKSFTSTAVGFAVAEGRISLDDEVLKFFPADAPTNASANLKAMRVRDLMIMSTGHQDEPPTAPELMSPASFFTQAVVHLPGTHFKYNTAATFMQSAIVQKVTGQTVLEYLQPRLFRPLGIEHPVWDANFQGVSLGGYGLRVRTEDIAKFGQFYLQQGRWEGQQLLPAEWVAQATAKQTSNGSHPKSDWNQGYGFQFWRCRHNAYRGDGAFGQYCIVLPDQDVVVAITSGIRDMQAALNLLWEKLLPGIRNQALPADEAAVSRLRTKLAGLEVRPAAGASSSPVAARVLGRTYFFPTNELRLESLMLAPAAGGDGGGLTMTLRVAGQSMVVPCGYRQWKTGRSPLWGGRLAQFTDEPVAGTFAWSTDDTCVIRSCAYETPFQTTMTLSFSGDEVVVDSEMNVAFGPTKRPRLTGRLGQPRP